MYDWLPTTPSLRRSLDCWSHAFVHWNRSLMSQWCLVVTRVFGAELLQSRPASLLVVDRYQHPDATDGALTTWHGVAEVPLRA